MTDTTTPPSPKLAPCPFCGEAATLKEWGACCDHCGCLGPDIHGTAFSLSLWNGSDSADLVAAKDAEIDRLRGLLKAHVCECDDRCCDPWWSQRDHAQCPCRVAAAYFREIEG